MITPCLGFVAKPAPVAVLVVYIASLHRYVEYNPALDYFAGDTFTVGPGRVLNIDSITVPPGLWGLPKAGTDVLGQKWSGIVIANPTGSAVPQFPYPTLASAQLIMAYC